MLETAIEKAAYIDEKMKQFKLVDMREQFRDIPLSLTGSACKGSGWSLVIAVPAWKIQKEQCLSSRSSKSPEVHKKIIMKSTNYAFFIV